MHRGFLHTHSCCLSLPAETPSTWAPCTVLWASVNHEEVGPLLKSYKTFQGGGQRDTLGPGVTPVGCVPAKPPACFPDLTLHRLVPTQGSVPCAPVGLWVFVDRTAGALPALVAPAPLTRLVPQTRRRKAVTCPPPRGPTQRLLPVLPGTFQAPHPLGRTAPRSSTCQRPLLIGWLGAAKEESPWAEPSGGGVWSPWKPQWTPGEHTRQTQVHGRDTRSHRTGSVRGRILAGAKFHLHVSWGLIGVSR